ncbi:hypothetical protein VM82_07220 [Pasteurella multocida]|nr:hypothetical protein VM82_07220 [Pasteurella multocida]
MIKSEKRCFQLIKHSVYKILHAVFYHMLLFISLRLGKCQSQYALLCKQDDKQRLFTASKVVCDCGIDIIHMPESADRV